MFWTILVHHQEQLYKLYIPFGICWYYTSGCCVAIATQQPHMQNEYCLRHIVFNYPWPVVIICERHDLKIVPHITYVLNVSIIFAEALRISGRIQGSNRNL